MRLQEAIKQKRFKSERHKAFLNIIWAHNLLTTWLEQRLKVEGLTMRQYNVLRILRGHYPEPMSMGDVKQRLLDRHSDLTRLISRLIDKGLVVRLDCPQDRRVVYVQITQSGLQLLSRLDVLENEIERHLGVLSEEEAAQLNALLDKICAAHEP